MESKKPYQSEEISKEIKPSTSIETKKEKSPAVKKPTAKKEVKDNRKKLVPIDVADKRKKSSVNEFNQIDLIDDFIKNQPSISKKLKEKTPTKEQQKDLSESSANFGEDLISENLAQILIKQGQKDKAIDIYKKLIWRIPQKKAYFATRIEELKK